MAGPTGQRRQVQPGAPGGALHVRVGDIRSIPRTEQRLAARVGKRHTDDSKKQSAVLSRLASAITAAGLWADLDATWLLLDTEILPWTAKAEAMIRSGVVGRNHR